MFRLLYISTWLRVYTLLLGCSPQKQSQWRYHIFCYKKKNINGASPFQIPYHPIFFKNKKVFKQKTDSMEFQISFHPEIGWFQLSRTPTSDGKPPIHPFPNGRAPWGRYQCVGLDHATRHRNQHDPGSFGWVAFDGLKLQVWHFWPRTRWRLQCQDMQLKFFFQTSLFEGEGIA